MPFSDLSKYALSDWNTSNKLLRTNAERLRDSSHTIRQDARCLRNETDNHTRWTQHDSNSKLENRIYHLNEWKRSLEKCLYDTEEEIEVLQVDKKKTEIALEAKKVSLAVAVQCLSLRENREGIDRVRDNVEEQLHIEVELIEGIKALLYQKVRESFEQLCLLEEARRQLHCDLTDKYHALKIDSDCHEINNVSDGISFQIDSSRTIKGSVTPETWNTFSQYNKLHGEAELKSSKRLRETIFATLEETKNDFESQRKATNYEFRKRVNDIKQAINELKWQRENTIDEVSLLEKDIEGLKTSIDAKMAPLQVAQTRLENRTERRNVELCRDTPQYQLCYELGEIEGSIKALTEKLRVAETDLQRLLKNLSRIENDLRVKSVSLQLDNQCMQSRSSLVEVDHTGREDKQTVCKQPDKMNTEVVTASPPQTFIDQNVHLNVGPQMRSTYDTDFNKQQSKRTRDFHRTLQQKEAVCI